MTVPTFLAADGQFLFGQLSLAPPLIDGNSPSSMSKLSLVTLDELIEMVKYLTSQADYVKQ